MWGQFLWQISKDTTTPTRRCVVLAQTWERILTGEIPSNFWLARATTYRNYDKIEYIRIRCSKLWKLVISCLSLKILQRMLHLFRRSQFVKLLGQHGKWPLELQGLVQLWKILAPTNQLPISLVQSALKIKDVKNDASAELKAITTINKRIWNYMSSISISFNFCNNFQPKFQCLLPAHQNYGSSTITVILKISTFNISSIDLLARLIHIKGGNKVC